MVNGIKKQVNKYRPDMELSGSGNTDYGHNLADKVLEQEKKDVLVKRAELENEIEFIKIIKTSRVNVDNIFDDREIKEKLLIEYQRYTKLNSFGKYKEILEYCSDAKIGLAFKNNYHSALNKIKKGMREN